MFDWFRRRGKKNHPQATKVAKPMANPNATSPQLKKLDERTQALKDLKNGSLTPQERFVLLMKTVTGPRDLVVIPESWQEAIDKSGVVKNVKHIFVNTPYPSIVRT